MSAKPKDCAAIAAAMRAGGFYQRIMDAGPELDRMKRFLQALAGEAPAPAALPQQEPDYPLFPGLRHRPWHDPAEIPGALALQQQAEVIRAEWLALQDADYLRYTPAAMHNLWQVHLLHYMGVDLAPVAPQCPRTHALLRQLPGVCLDYPWGDALLSVHASDSHLRAHCSVDNLRVRCHLALQVPPGCSIRVGQETRNWQQGQVLLFEDSFEHEVWNRGQTRRAILIVDFWHPDLSTIEIAALTAGFAHATVREQFMLNRLGMAQSVPASFEPHLRRQIALQDRLPERLCFWNDT